MIDWTTEIVGENKDIVLFNLSGRLDTADCDYLFDVLNGYIEEGRKRLILNCHDLEFVSSIGLGVFVRIHARMKRHDGDVRLARVRGAVAEVIRLVMLDRLLKMYPSVREAIASYSD